MRVSQTHKVHTVQTHAHALARSHAHTKQIQTRTLTAAPMCGFEEYKGSQSVVLRWKCAIKIDIHNSMLCYVCMSACVVGRFSLVSIAVFGTLCVCVYIVCLTIFSLSLIRCQRTRFGRNVQTHTRRYTRPDSQRFDERSKKKMLQHNEKYIKSTDSSINPSQIDFHNCRKGILRMLTLALSFSM